MALRDRSTRARNNDVAIRSAAIELILSSGLDAISFRDVGKAAGLSHGALYARFEDVEELLVDLWSEVLSDRVISLFEASKYAAALPSEDSVAAVLQRVRDAEQSDVAAVQVLLLSRRFLVLREEVEYFIRDYLETKPADMDQSIWSRTLVLFALVMVKIFSNSEFGLNRDRLNFMQPVLTAALRMDPNDVSPIEVPESMPNVDSVPRNDLQSQLALNTYSAVGASGYTKATISRISRRAKCSPGAIYKLFPSKDDLVVFAVRRMMANQDLLPSRIARILDEGVLTEALYMSASSRSNLRKFFFMEMMLASAHNEKLRGAVAAQFQRVDGVAATVDDISDEDRLHIEFTLREVTLLVLGVAFLSTVTSATNDIDFAQFCEPFRISLLDCCFPSWPDIAQQLRAYAPERGDNARGE